MQVSVFGLGYVGCISAVCLAEAGHDVVGVDINKEKVTMINAGTPPIVEPGLEEALSGVMQTGRLRATVSSEEAVGASELALICVGTPGHGNGRTNLDALARVAHDIGLALGRQRKAYTVVVRSTVMPGTTSDLVMPALLAGTGDRYPADLKVAVNPEFMREGSALRDFLYPPFTIVGCDDEVTAGRLCELYAGVNAPFLHTEVRTAEMLKYAANAFHALKVCFANEMGDICEALQVDAREVMRVFCCDKKLNISDAYLRPGFAFGGSCLPKDLRALTYAAHSADLDIPLLSTLLPANAARIRHAVDAILATHKRRIGVLGLAFKSATDDLRESPMVSVVESLIGKGCHLKILDHNVALARLVGANRRYIEEEIPHIASLMCESAEELLAHAEVLVVGNADEQSTAVVRAAAPRRIVLDLTRSLPGLSPVASQTLAPECQPQPLPLEAVSPRSALASSP